MFHCAVAAAQMMKSRILRRPLSGKVVAHFNLPGKRQMRTSTSSILRHGILDRNLSSVRPTSSRRRLQPKSTLGGGIGGAEM